MCIAKFFILPIMLGPNITGVISNLDGYSGRNVGSGAFYNGSIYSAWNPDGGNDGNAIRMYFDASRSDSTYTTNGNVYPLSLTLNYVIKA